MKQGMLNSELEFTIQAELTENPWDSQYVL